MESLENIQGNVLVRSVSSIRRALQKRKAYKKAQKEFKAMLNTMLQAGTFSETDVKSLRSFMINNQLSEKILNKVKLQSYNIIFNAMKADNRITSVEIDDLERLKKFFRLNSGDVAYSQAELSRIHLLTDINAGNIPTIFPQNVLLQKDETAFWEASALWKEERVVSRKYVGGSQGVSFRIMKGVSYRVGSSRGHLVSESGIVPIATGQFIVTNKRLIFAGVEKSFQIPYAKVINLQMFSDGLNIQTGVGKTKWVQFDDEFGDIVGALLSHASNKIS